MFAAFGNSSGHGSFAQVKQNKGGHAAQPGLLPTA
jgi:hypothetical protein